MSPSENTGLFKVDTWLSQKDVERLWKVVNGEIIESAATYNEIVEFHRIVEIVGKQKQSGYRDNNSLS